MDNLFITWLVCILGVGLLAGSSLLIYMVSNISAKIDDILRISKKVDKYYE